jgi:hypothetical protein
MISPKSCVGTTIDEQKIMEQNLEMKSWNQPGGTNDPEPTPWNKQKFHRAAKPSQFHAAIRCDGTA